jgi:acetyl-CoA carboxylase biotin carboxyl carrier protein
VTQDIDAKLVRKLAKLLEETGLGELEYSIDNWKIRVVKPTIVISDQQKTMLIPTKNSIVDNDDTIKKFDSACVLKSPMVGTAYLTPDPSSPPFVDLGSNVKEGDTVMIIEAMKVMNPISAHRTGVVREIFINTNDPLEFGQSLMVIE